MDFKFYHPIEVRYGDLDPQGHVNNARYLTYMEQARIRYIQHLGLWKGGSFMDVGIILADFHVTFRAPVTFGQSVRVGVRVDRLGYNPGELESSSSPHPYKGSKSMDMHYVIEDAETGQALAEGASVLVAYDYHNSRSIPIPDEWRRIIAHFEDLSWSEQP